MSPVSSKNVRVSVAAAAVAVAFLLSAVGLMLWDTRKTALTRSAESLANLTLSLEHDLSRSLGSYEVLLDAVADGRQQVEGPSGAEAKWRLVASRLEGELFGTILVTDADGRVVQSSRPTASPLNLADRAYFTVQRDHADMGVLFGEVELGRETERPKLSFSRRLASPDGRFAGVVVGNVKLDYFKQAFAEFQLGPGGTIALLTSDGRLLAASPMRHSPAGLDLSASAVMQRLRTAGPGIFQAKSVVDGQTRLYSARALAHLPMYILAGTSVRGVYADWMTRLWATCGVVAGFLAILGFVGVVLRRELRRRARAERHAHATAGELKLIADTVDDLILKLDWDGTRRFVSPASLQLLGIPAEEFQGGNAFADVHPDDRQKIASALDGMRHGDATSHLVVYRVQHKDGGWRHVEARGRALPDASGAIVVARDVSERTKLEEQLRQAQRMDAIGQLTAGVAHDFNNLLQSQMASLQLLLDRVEGQEKAVQHAMMALHAAERGAQLTHSLLAFSRKQLLRPEPVRLVDLLSRVGVILSRTTKPNIQVRVDVRSDLAPPFADPGQLETAVLNLCLNGRDAMQDRGGLLLIEVYSRLDFQRAEDADRSRRCIVVAVTDTGSGMDSATMARAREPFFTTKGIGKGTGLGLSMVDGFARQSGGELRLESRPGAGTRIEIWLPEAAAQARSPLAEALAPASTVDQPDGNLSNGARSSGRQSNSGMLSGGLSNGVQSSGGQSNGEHLSGERSSGSQSNGCLQNDAPSTGDQSSGAQPNGAQSNGAQSNDGRRVLLVDDDAGVLCMLGEMLGAAGFVVSLAGNGETALTMLRKDRFDALVTDYAMPGMNGGELVGIARRSHPGLPTLIITGYADDAHIVEVPIEVEVLKKPFRMDDLVNRLAALVAGRCDHRPHAGHDSRHGQAGRDRLVGATA